MKIVERVQFENRTEPIILYDILTNESNEMDCILKVQAIFKVDFLKAKKIVSKFINNPNILIKKKYEKARA